MTIIIIIVCNVLVEHERCPTSIRCITHARGQLRARFFNFNKLLGECDKCNLDNLMLKPKTRKTGLTDSSWLG